MNIFVGNLHFDTTVDDLRTVFERYGRVESVAIIQDRESGKSRGFGFVEILDRGFALMAIQTLNGAELDGRTLVVNEARPKKEREPQYRARG